MTQNTISIKSKYRLPTALLAVCTCLLWASAFVPLKMGLTEFPYPLQFASFRFIIAGFLISIIAGWNREYIKEVKEHIGTVLIICLFSTILLYTFFYTGQQRVDSSLASLIIGSQPLFVTLIAHFTTKGDKLTIKKTLCILLGLSGLVVIAAPNLSRDSVMGFSVAIGILLLLGNNLSGAVSNVMISKIKKDTIKPLVLSSSQLIIGSITLFVMSMIFEGGVHSPPLTSKFILCFGALIFISTVSISIWYTLLARDNVSVSSLNMWKFIIPVMGTILSWLFVDGEVPTLYTMIGLVLLTLSLVFLYWSSFRRFFYKIFEKNKIS